MSKHIDVAATGVLTRASIIGQTNDTLNGRIEGIGNGRLPRAEALDQREVAMAKLYRFA